MNDPIQPRVIRARHFVPGQMQYAVTTTGDPVVHPIQIGRDTRWSAGVPAWAMPDQRLTVRPVGVVAEAIAALHALHIVSRAEAAVMLSLWARLARLGDDGRRAVLEFFDHDGGVR